MSIFFPGLMMGDFKAEYKCFAALTYINQIEACHPNEIRQ